MLIIEIANKELTGGHIAIMLIIEICQCRINRLPYWNNANYRDAKIELTGCHIGIMLILEMVKTELSAAFWNYANYRYLPNFN